MAVRDWGPTQASTSGSALHLVDPGASTNSRLKLQKIPRVAVPVIAVAPPTIPRDGLQRRRRPSPRLAPGGSAFSQSGVAEASVPHTGNIARMHQTIPMGSCQATSISGRGDVMEAEIERIGVLRNPIISWEEAHGS